MCGHDRLCPRSEPDPGDTVRQTQCLCHLILKVRADEMQQVMAVVEADEADLRAKVEVLPWRDACWGLRRQVLALLDGSSDDA